MFEFKIVVILRKRKEYEINYSDFNLIRSHYYSYLFKKRILNALQILASFLVFGVFLVDFFLDAGTGSALNEVSFLNFGIALLVSLGTLGLFEISLFVINVLLFSFYRKQIILHLNIDSSDVEITKRSAARKKFFNTKLF